MTPISTVSESKTGLKSAHLSSPLGSPAVAPHLSMRVSCTPFGASFIAHQYATYPFRLSVNLQLDPTDLDRVYAYIMNASPGILSGDDLQLNLHLGAGAKLYLTDQSATKIHSQPIGGSSAQTWMMKVGEQAYLEYVPEPVILFAASSFSQKTQVILHPDGQLVLGEIIVPGRLARGEYYAFDRFSSRLEVKTPEGKLCFADNQVLQGRLNPFKHNAFLAQLPIMGNFILVVPGIALADLAQLIHDYNVPSNILQVGHSPLPNCKGFLVRAIASQVSVIKAYQHHLLNCVRQLSHQPSLPNIPK